MQQQYYRVVIYIESNDSSCPLQQIDHLSNISESDILDILSTSHPQLQVSQLSQTKPFPTQKDSLLSRILKKQFAESHSENIDLSSRRRSMLNPPELRRFEPDFYLFKKEETLTPRYSSRQKITEHRSEKKKISEKMYRPCQENYPYRNPYEDDQRAHRSATCLKERPSPQKLGLIERTLLDRRGSTRTPNSRQQRERDCKICLEAINDYKPWKKLRNCPDVFHFQCLEKQLQIKIDERSLPIECPECRKELNYEDIKDALQTDLQYQLKFDQYSFQAYLNTHPQEFDLCETPDCNYPYLKNSSQMRFDCPKCQRVYCKDCKINWTNGHSCGKLKEIQDYYANESRNQQNPNYYHNAPMQNPARQTAKLGFTDQEFKNYADGKGYKTCPRCTITIERTEGCLHMTCSLCKMEFCYLTGQDFKQCRCGRH